MMSREDLFLDDEPLLIIKKKKNYGFQMPSL